MVRKKTKIKQLEVAIPEIIGEVTTSVIEALTNWISLETIYKAQERGLLAFHENKVKYIIQNKTYRVTDPEEAVRIAFYLELIDRYQYPPERINFEVEVPGRTPDVQADIVVFEDDAHKKPYIVVECKKDGISPAELAQAEKQAIGNANALRSKYCILVAGTIRIARDIAGFAQDEREKNIIADIPIRYGKVIKFKYKKGDEPWELKDVTKDELLAKFQQCHDALWEGGRRNPAEAFDEMSKLMYCKIQDERFLTKKGEHYRFQVGTHETVNEVGERIKDIYKDAQKIDKEVFTEPIKTDNPIIYTVAEILQGISLARTDLDVKGEGYEHFLGGVFRGAMGQYFTPRPIVAFMVDFIEPIVSDLIIDPACGSGGFLIHTLEKMRKELHAKLDEKDADYRWQDFALKQVYGIEINSQLARVAMMNMIIHEDGHTNIENADALDNSETWKRQKIREYLGKDFSLLLTNPPFGASVKEREKAYLANYELGGKIKKRNRQKTEILFIERCLDFLKPGGRMGIVLPDGILSNSSLQYVRDFITERAQILGIVSLPQTAFKRPSSKGSGDSGSGVKASLLFLRKKRERETLPKDYPIFMGIAEHIGYDATGRPDKDEFPDILKAWQEFRKTNKIDFFVKAPLSFAVGRGGIEGRFDPFYYKPQYRKMEETLKMSAYPIVKLHDVVDDIRNGSTPPGGKFEEEGIPFIRSQNFDLDGVKVKQYITEDFHNQLERSKVKSGDVLIAVVGATLGVIGYVQENIREANINQNVARLIVKEKVNSKYLAIYLDSKFGKEQILRTATLTTQNYLNNQLLENIFIILPSRRIQDKIAEIMDEAYRLKKEKEAEAEKLLNSIDAYVLNELGIKLNGAKEEKVFATTFDKIRGKRFDPYSRQPKYEKFDQSLQKGLYQIKLLGSYLTDIKYGASVKNIYAEEGIPLLRITNLKPNQINLSEVVKLPYEKKNEIGNCYVQEGDFLISRSGTLGITAIVPKEANGSAYGSFMIRFRIKEEKLDSSYLSTIMNSKIVRVQILRTKIGAIQGNITIPAIEELKIPLPPVSVQQKIAEEVNSRREKAKKLKAEAKEIVSKAKEKVEKMILGNDIN